METAPIGSLPAIPGPTPGAFRWQKLPAWCACCVVLGTLIGWAAVVARGYAAPLVLFPLAAGTVLGGTLVLAIRILDVGHRPTVWFGAILAGLVTVAAEHYFIFRTAQHRLDVDPERTVKLRLVAPERVPPSRFWEYMAWSAARGAPIGSHVVEGGWAWFMWSVDGLFVLVPVVVLAGATVRLPYCNRCRQWYHTVRSGRLDRHAATKLHTLALTRLEGEMARNRYRILACQGACGPTGLVLSGELPEGRPFTQTIWLDASGRQQITEILDESTQRQTEDEIRQPPCEAAIPEQRDENTG